MKLPLALFMLSVLSSCLSAKERPNILLIMADDLGAEVLGCYGNSYHQTPHLDQMAKEGALFNNAFATPVCTPTRAMILTGLHPNRTGFLERLDSPKDHGDKNRLPKHLMTFGSIFQATGYKTAIAGKWHLGNFNTYPDQPTSHGFDEHCLWVQVWDNIRRSRFFAPHNYENHNYKIHENDIYGPDYYCDFLLDFIEKNKEQSFFAYFPMNLIHTPIHTPPGDHSFADSKLPKNSNEKQLNIARMTTYMDKIIGRMIQKLKELQLDKNTLVIFTGDNGSASTSQLGNFTLKGGKRTMNEAGTRVPFIAKWPGVIPPGQRDAMFSLLDVLPTLASLANIPLNHHVDGMDLSHNFKNTPGVDRKFFMMAFEGECYFIRNNRYRLHEDGRFYNVPFTSIPARYSMKETQVTPENKKVKEVLEKELEKFMSIQKTDQSYQVIPFGTNGDKFKNDQQKKSK